MKSMAAVLDNCCQYAWRAGRRPALYCHVATNSAIHASCIGLKASLSAPSARGGSFLSCPRCGLMTTLRSMLSHHLRHHVSSAAMQELHNHPTAHSPAATERRLIEHQLPRWLPATHLAVPLLAPFQPLQSWRANVAGGDRANVTHTPPPPLHRSRQSPPAPRPLPAAARGRGKRGVPPPAAAMLGVGSSALARDAERRPATPARGRRTCRQGAPRCAAARHGAPGYARAPPLDSSAG